MIAEKYQRQACESEPADTAIRSRSHPGYRNSAIRMAFDEHFKNP
jgi:hypothetical protein